MDIGFVHNVCHLVKIFFAIEDFAMLGTYISDYVRVLVPVDNYLTVIDRLVISLSMSLYRKCFVNMTSPICVTLRLVLQ